MKRSFREKEENCVLWIQFLRFGPEKCCCCRQSVGVWLFGVSREKKPRVFGIFAADAEM